MSAVKKIVDTIVGWACILILGFMTVLVTYQVVTRYVLNAPSAISETLAKYLFVWLVMLGAAYVFGLREHMNIGVVRDKLPHKPRIIVEMFGELVVAGFSLVIMIYGGYTGTLQQMVQIDPSLGIPTGIIYAGIPISGVLILFYFIYNEIYLVKQLTNPDKK